MGCSVAVRLAEQGADVVLFEQKPELMQGASRYNEGKIHLGCLYPVSGNLDTAKRMLTGGLRFFSLVERLLEQTVDSFITPAKDTYLVHKDSLVSLEETASYMLNLAELVADHPDVGLYPGVLNKQAFNQIPLEGFGALTGDNVCGAIEVPERSIATGPIADLVVKRVKSQPRLTIRTRSRVTDIKSQGGSNMNIVISDDVEAGFDVVINACWEGRPKLDAAYQGSTDPEPHHRYRMSVFLDGGAEIDHPSAVVGFGPFGDFKNYGDGRAYLSWYPAGLLVQHEGITPPPPPEPNNQTQMNLVENALSGLKESLPDLSKIDFSNAYVGGGWVYSQAKGQLHDIHSGLHHRDLFGVRVNGRYISIDTGKYSMAPYLAEGVVSMLLDD